MWLITLVKGSKGVKETFVKKTKKMNLELGLYKHFKGNIYEVIAIAKDHETLDLLVIYKATYQPEGLNLWVRPLTMFTEELMIEGIKTKRFTKI